MKSYNHNVRSNNKSPDSAPLYQFNLNIMSPRSQASLKAKITPAKILVAKPPIEESDD